MDYKSIEKKLMSLPRYIQNLGFPFLKLFERWVSKRIG